MQRWSISRQYHGNLWPNFRHLRPPIIPALGPFRGRWASSRVRLRGMAFVPQILSFHVTHRMPASAHRWFKADKLQSFFRGQQRLVPVMQTFLSPWAWWKTLIEAQMQKICLSGIYPKPHCEGFSACFNVFSTFNVDPRWSTWIHFGVSWRGTAIFSNSCTASFQTWGNFDAAIQAMDWRGNDTVGDL